MSSFFYKSRLNIRSVMLLLVFTMMFSVAVKGRDVKAESNEKIYEDADKNLELKYDDRYSFADAIDKIITVSVKSKNVKTGKKDENVLKINSENEKQVIAVGCGRAVVVLKNGKNIAVKVKASKISLILLIGQSNMEGSPNKKGNPEEYKKQYLVNKQGKVYNTYGPSTVNHSLTNGCFSEKSPKLTIWNADEFVPETLTDNSSSKEWKRTNNMTDADGAVGKTGIDSALAQEWVKKTGEKVWLVNAAHSGHSIKTWLPGKQRTNNNFWQAVTLYKTCANVLNKEIEAGHYKMSHKGYYWLQGETDARMNAADYMRDYMSMHNALKRELADNLGEILYKNVRKKLEFAGILMVRAHKNPRDISDLSMTGPRKAQYYMCNSNQMEYRDIFLASQIAEDWATDEGVAAYFTDKYGSAENYLAVNSNIKSENIKMPSKVTDVHETVHYTQLAYNELGRDAADNICYALKLTKVPSQKPVIKFVGTDGYTEVDSFVCSSSENMSLTLKVYPSYKSKSVKLMRTKGVKINRWNVSLDVSKYFSGKFKFTIGKKVHIFNLYSQDGICKLKGIYKTFMGVQINWESLPKAEYYVVYKRPQGTSKWKTVAKCKKDTVSYIDSEPYTGVTHEYKVCAYNKKGSEGQPAIASVLA